MLNKILFIQSIFVFTKYTHSRNSMVKTDVEL